MSSRNTATVVTAEVVTEALAKRNFTQEEEKVLRMRNGAKVSGAAPLPKAAGANEELGDELLLIEMQLLRSIKARKGGSVTAGVKLERNPTKEKIARALKAKKN